MKSCNILITGTPGVGKTTLSKMVANSLDMKHIELSAAIQKHKLYSEWDYDLDCSIFDDDLVDEYLQKEMANGNCIIDFHSCIFDPELKFDKVFVLRTDNTILYDRLVERNYSTPKIQANIECEIFHTILDEARDEFDESTIVELNNDNKSQSERNFDIIVRAIKSIQAKNENEPSKNTKPKN